MVHARALIESGLGSGAFPAATIDVGRATGPVWQAAFGRLTYDAGAPATTLATIFDLASLTKVMATTSLVMRAIEAGRLALDAPVADLLPAWRGADRRDVRIRHLLDHSSGLPARVHLWERAGGREEYARAICEVPLERAPGAASVYSDTGFILLGFALEAATGWPLDTGFSRLDEALSTGAVYNPPVGWRDHIAPTEFDPSRGRLLVGEVHDENAAALGGVAGHAGLFGTAAGVGAFARVVLRTFAAKTALGSPALMHLFSTRTGVAGSSRALGWDTMLPTSSCGTALSAAAIGHTGFTGTSLWIDPPRDLYVVFLTNRVHPTRKNQALAELRPRLHDAIVRDLESDS